MKDKNRLNLWCMLTEMGPLWFYYFSELIRHTYTLAHRILAWLPLGPTTRLSAAIMAKYFNGPFFILVFNTLLCFFHPWLHFWSPMISAVTEAQSWPVKATIYCQTGNTMELTVTWLKILFWCFMFCHIPGGLLMRGTARASLDKPFQPTSNKCKHVEAVAREDSKIGKNKSDMPYCKFCQHHVDCGDACKDNL